MKRRHLTRLFCMMAVLIGAAAAHGAAAIAYRPLNGPGNATSFSAIAAGRPALLAFWRDDCAPCRDELPTLARYAAAHPSQPLGLVTLGDPNAARKALPTVLPVNLHALATTASPETVFAAYGATMHALPFSVALHGDARLCARHYGPLGEDMIETWMRQC